MDENSRKSSFLVEKIAPDVWRFNEGMGSYQYVDAYLIVGKERAALIDALQSEQPVHLAQQIREITNLPVDVLITHGHGDHAGAEIKYLAGEEGFYLHMNMDDFPIAQRIFSPWMTPGSLKDIHDGEEFDLGGTKLTAYRVAGHTPGSMVFLDKDNLRCFTGDAFGVWLQLDHSLLLSVYLSELRRFEKIIEGMPEIKFYGGHLSQAPYQLTQQHLIDMRTVCEKIMSREIVGDEVTPPAGSPTAGLMAGARTATLGTANIVYRENKLS